MAKKVSSSKAFTYNGIVGADTSKTMPDGERVARHLHLVEFGFEHEGGKVVPGQHPLQKGFDQSQSRCQAVYEEKLASEVEKEARKA